jgi:hypothetical protein
LSITPADLGLILEGIDLRAPRRLRHAATAPAQN